MAAPCTAWRNGWARVGAAWAPLTDGLLAVLLAPRCAACEISLPTARGGPVCTACWTAVRPFTPPLCEACGEPLGWRDASRCPRCAGTDRAIRRAAAIGPYEGTLAEIIHALKYQGRRSVAGRLAGLMAHRGAHVLAGADLVVPVPLHWRRRHARGFNQAAALAEGLPLPVRHALRRVRATVPQVGLAAAARQANVRRAFRLAGAGSRRARARWMRRLAGRCVVVVDDVSTTGATLEACAEVLLRAGAREVRALTAARAVSKPR